MSLLIVGSTSRITQHIILQLSKLNAYKSITISDLLPTYEFHNRYYRLRKALAESNSSTSVSLSKLTRTEQLYNQIKNHQDILFVTHDYFHSVTSKTKLMELTAEYSKNVKMPCFRKKMFTSLPQLSTITSDSKIHFKTISNLKIKSYQLIKMHLSIVLMSKKEPSLSHISTKTKLHQARISVLIY